MTQSEDTLRPELATANAAAVVVVILGIFMFNCYADVGGTSHTYVAQVLPAPRPGHVQCH